MKKKEMGKKEVGKYGEKKAVEYLINKGFKIIEKNYLLKIGEVDIIARDKNTIVFVEVKTRRSNHFGPPSAAINYRKQQKIRKLAQWYLQKANIKGFNIRFDVIAISIKNRKGKLKHYKNAF